MSLSSEKSVAKSQRKQFDLLSPSEHIGIRSIRRSEISKAAQFASRHLPSLKLGNLSIFERIVALDCDSIQLFESGGKLVGLYAMLFLNRTGEEALLAGNFDGANPCTSLLAQKCEKPAAIYTWFVACPGRAASGIGNIAQYLQGARFAHADLFARPATAAGLRIMRSTGHYPISSDPNGLHCYRRILNRPLSSQKAA